MDRQAQTTTQRERSRSILRTRRRANFKLDYRVYLVTRCVETNRDGTRQFKCTQGVWTPFTPYRYCIFAPLLQSPAGLLSFSPLRAKTHLPTSGHCLRCDQSFFSPSSLPGSISILFHRCAHRWSKVVVSDPYGVLYNNNALAPSSLADRLFIFPSSFHLQFPPQMQHSSFSHIHTTRYSIRPPHHP